MAWGASHLIYAEAQDSQCQGDWTMGHVRGFEYSGCVPSMVVQSWLSTCADFAKSDHEAVFVNGPAEISKHPRRFVDQASQCVVREVAGTCVRMFPGRRHPYHRPPHGDSLSSRFPVRAWR